MDRGPAVFRVVFVFFAGVLFFFESDFVRVFDRTVFLVEDLVVAGFSDFMDGRSFLASPEAWTTFKPRGGKGPMKLTESRITFVESCSTTP